MFGDTDGTHDSEMLLPSLRQPPRTVFVRMGARPAAPPRVRLPGSKYLTLRYLLAALLAEGESLIMGPALSEDTAVLVRALRALGAHTTWERAPEDAEGGVGEWALRVRGTAGRLMAPPGRVLAVGNAGAVLRLLLGICALLPEIRFETDHPASLGTRPNADLLDAVRALGIQAEAREPGGLLPITLRGGPPRGGEVRISGAKSSQYISALLYLAPLLPEGLRITLVDELRSAPMVRLTLHVLEQVGITVAASPDLRELHIPGGQRYRAGTYRVPGDAPSAAALLAAALLAGAPLTLARLDPLEAAMSATLAAFAALGAPVLGVLGGALPGNVRLRGARLDGDACIDSVPALVAAACFAEGETAVERVATLRLKESDRIGDLCAELARAGCAVAPGADTLYVRGHPEGVRGGVRVDGHDDHRLVQAQALVALRCADGLTITGADAVAKSYPEFFEDLRQLGAVVEAIE